MNSTWMRFSHLCTLYSISVIICGLYAYLTGYVIDRKTFHKLGEINHADIVKLGKNFKNRELGLLDIDLSFDGTKKINWNSNIFYLYAVTEYELADSTRHQTIVWDKILHTDLNGKVKYQGKAKYLLEECNGKFSDRPLVTSLQMYTLPKGGFFHQSNTLSDSYIFKPYR